MERPRVSFPDRDRMVVPLEVRIVVPLEVRTWVMPRLLTVMVLGSDIRLSLVTLPVRVTGSRLFVMRVVPMDLRPYLPSRILTDFG